MRVTWIQPEDLVGHELRQAREEGKDVDAIEARWLAAGGAPAPAARRVAGPGRAASSARLALELLDELDALPRPLADRRAGGARRDPRALLDPAPVAPDGRLGDRVAGAWLGRAAGCVLGKPVENLPREGIRAIAQAHRELAGARRGSPPSGLAGGRLGALALEPREPADEPRREHRRRCPEDDDLNFTMLGRGRCSSAAGTDFTTVDVAKALARLPAARGGSSPPSAWRCATCSRAHLPPGDRDAAQPVPRVDRRPAARRRLRLGRAGRPVARRAHGVGGRPAQPHGERRLRRDVHGGRARRVARRRVERRSAPTPGSSVVPPRSRLAEALRDRARARARSGLGGRRRRVYEARYGDYHWVHAINNTALVAAALYAFDGDFSGAICAAVQGGLDTDTNGAAVGSVLGAIAAGPDRGALGRRRCDGRFSTLAAGLRRRSTVDELARRTLALVAEPLRT